MGFGKRKTGKMRIAFLKKALEWRKTFDSSSLIKSHISLGTNYLKQGILRKAKEQFEEGAELTETQNIDSLILAEHLVLGGYIEIYWGNFAQSVDYLHQAENVFIGFRFDRAYHLWHLPIPYWGMIMVPLKN